MAEVRKELKDTAGHHLIKVKEGALHIERLISFTHEKKHYVLNNNGELVKQAD